MHIVRAQHAFDGTRFLPGGATIVVEEDRILAVETGRVEPPSDVPLVEHAGTVLPGLVDCHTHLVADGTEGGLERTATMEADAVDEVIVRSLRAHARAGVTTVRDLGDLGYRTLAHRARPGLPRVVASGPPLTIPGGHCHFLGGAVRDGDLDGAVAERVERGVDVVKVMASGGFVTSGTDVLGAQFTVAELAGVVDQAHRAGRPVVAHAHSVVGIRNAVAAGVDGIEHFTGLAPGGPRFDDDLLEEVARQGTYVDLTLGSDREVQRRMPDLPPVLVELLAGARSPTLDEFYGRQLTVLGRLREHGVTVVAGVDSGIGPMKEHGNVWRTVGEMVDAGYPVAEALAAATSVAAGACGLGLETGRLAPGYAADLLVVDGDLARDPSLLGSPARVLVRGVQVDLT